MDKKLAEAATRLRAIDHSVLEKELQTNQQTQYDAIIIIREYLRLQDIAKESRGDRVMLSEYIDWHPCMNDDCPFCIRLSPDAN